MTAQTVKCLSVGSLFSGIGGLDLGLERNGMQVKWQCEINEYARKVLEKHWPEVPIYNDVTKMNGAEVEHVDLICGGFPCQDISVAGRGVGITGSRSGLFFEMARIIGEAKPDWCLFENVPMLTHRGMGAVVAEIHRLGYHCECNVISAASIGAWHRRDRVFIVCNRNPDVFPLFDCADGIAMRYDAYLRNRTEGGGIWNAEPDIPRVTTDSTNRSDRLRCLGNAVVPQVGEYIGSRIMSKAVS